MRALVVLAATVIPATPLVILSPLVFPAPVFVFTPFLARSNGPENIGHVKTGFARKGGYLKAFPEASSSLESLTFSPLMHQLFLQPSKDDECCERHRSDRSDPELVILFLAQES